MSVAKDSAFALRDLYGITQIPGDRRLDAILRDFGLRVVEFSASYPRIENGADRQDDHHTTPRRWSMSRVREAWSADVVLIRTDLSRDWKRWLKAHVIGHRALHVGDQLALDRLSSRHQEQQANVFAGWLFFGELPPPEWVGLTITVPMAAAAARIPAECLWEWWHLVRAAGMAIGNLT